MPTNVRDPRSIITPDAFGISPDLLGTPLAPPWRRFWALMIDLVVISILTAMFDGVWMFVWGAVGLAFLWTALRKTPGRTSQPMSVMLRAATGCLGFSVLGAVGLAWLAISLSEDDRGAGSIRVPDVPGVEDVGIPGGTGIDLGDVLRIAAGGGPLAEAETEDEAEDAAVGLLRDLGGTALSRDDAREVLEALTPEDAPWKDDADAIYARALDRWESEEEGGDATDPVSAGARDTAETADVAAMSDAEVLEAFARALQAEEPARGPRARALRARATELIAADTLAVLDRRLDRARESLAEERQRRREAEASEDGSAFVALLRDVWEQLGSAIGLWSLYFTVLLTVWNGQTIGKRLLGLRVLRLEGEPIGWWPAFERAGGYIAGLATGLLGFAQVFWDPNRQCIHDKIVGTVVVDLRAPVVPGAWQEAWQEPDEEGP